MLHVSQAYSRVAKSGLTGPRLLAAALSQSAIDLQRALDAREAGLSSGLLTEALERNRRVWSVIVDDIDDPEATLPPEVRRSLARLAVFVFRETFALCREPELGRLTPLIDVNRALASSFERAAA